MNPIMQNNFFLTPLETPGDPLETPWKCQGLVIPCVTPSSICCLCWLGKRRSSAHEH